MDKLKKLKNKFVKICINDAPACRVDERTGKKEVQLFARPDLYELAKKAFKEGKDSFCFKKTANNQIIEAKPEYIYHLTLTQKEFEDIFGEK